MPAVRRGGTAPLAKVRALLGFLWWFWQSLALLDCIWVPAGSQCSAGAEPACKCISLLSLVPYGSNMLPRGGFEAKPPSSNTVTLCLHPAHGWKERGQGRRAPAQQKEHPQDAPQTFGTSPSSDTGSNHQENQAATWRSPEQQLNHPVTNEPGAQLGSHPLPGCTHHPHPHPRPNRLNTSETKAPQHPARVLLPHPKVSLWQ